MLSSIAERIKNSGLKNGATLIEEIKLLGEQQGQTGVKKIINSELWLACAGPLVSLPQVGSLAYYFPQGHSEQVAISTKRISNSHIPNYSNLPSQLLCQVHNITLHADMDTDEVYAQIALQPVNPEKEVFLDPDFGLMQSKQPPEVFCKTLTASDTSTHGGFSVPRRAAEKLFPPLDFSMKPPTQELVVKDLHDNSWTFRHIYRGQPKRHLLTTGWSVFVNAKRLKAGDSVLFIRDEKSQLLVGIRRANRLQTTLPSSVLSADSMHIGVLAAAAHAAANHSPFTAFYNPRACPSQFVISLAKHRKAVYSAHVSIGTRFGMMFDTEESGKHRYMGTIIGISDIDPVRWPNSKWRNLQVEWDDPGYGEKQNRVSIWEIEIPETPFFIFPTPMSTLKRPFQPGSLLSGKETEGESTIKRPLSWIHENGIDDLQYSLIPVLSPEQQTRMLPKPQIISPDVQLLQLQEQLLPFRSNWKHNQNPEHFLEQGQAMDSNLLLQTQMPPREPTTNDPFLEQHYQGPQIKHEQNENFQNSFHITKTKNLEISSRTLQNFHPGQLSQPISPVKVSNENLLVGTPNPQNLVNKQFLHEGKVTHLQKTQNPPLETHSPNTLLQYQIQQPSQYENFEEWDAHPSCCQSLTSKPDYSFLSGPVNANIVEIMNPAPSIPFPWITNAEGNQNVHSFEQESFSLPQSSYLGNPYQEKQSNPCWLRDVPEESNEQSETYSNLHFEVSNASTLVDPSVSSVVLEGFSFDNQSGLVGSFSSSQDLQSQVTSASLADSHAFSIQEIPDNSGGTSSSTVDIEENGLLHNSSWQHVSPPLRTYTKVQKLGSVGRSIDISRFKNYNELKFTIAHMFGLEGKLDDPSASGWKLVYVDYENDILLVGDDPWEEFVGCVRCIRILSPSEVQQMSQEGMNLLSRMAVHMLTF